MAVWFAVDFHLYESLCLRFHRRLLRPIGVLGGELINDLMVAQEDPKS